MYGGRLILKRPPRGAANAMSRRTKGTRRRPLPVQTLCTRSRFVHGYKAGVWGETAGGAGVVGRDKRTTGAIRDAAYWAVLSGAKGERADEARRRSKSDSTPAVWVDERFDSSPAGSQVEGSSPLRRCQDIAVDSTGLFCTC